MTLTVVSVAYPLAAVSPDSAGGAEQVLATLDSALGARGHRSIVIACEGSRVAGSLRAISARSGPLDDAARTAAQADVRRALACAIRDERPDVVHLHGIDFPAYLPAPGPPVLATLHLPPEWYPPSALQPTRPDTWLNCVSAAQHATCPPSSALLAPIPNGVPVEALLKSYGKRNFALFLGRICPEKGVDLAIEAARLAGVPLVIAGQVYSYETHLAYFEQAIRPHLGRACRFIGPVGFTAKRRLLTQARCLLVSSLAAETSSLVAREAAACGTPVLAFPNGAMAEAVEDGRTGYLVSDAAGMAAAILACGAIEPDTCRGVAAARFSEAQMIDGYLALYRRLASKAPGRVG